MNASNGPSILFHTFDASYVIHCKNDRIVATNVGPKCNKGKPCIWVPKTYVTNLTGPNTSWGLISQAKIPCRFMHPGAQARSLIADA
jgi:hypothetical protein